MSQRPDFFWGEVWSCQPAIGFFLGGVEVDLSEPTAGFFLGEVEFEDVVYLGEPTAEFFLGDSRVLFKLG